MSKTYKLDDFTHASFLHGSIEKFSYYPQKKYFQIVFSYMNFKSGGCLLERSITVTNWSHLEVFEYNKQQVVKQFELDKISEIDRVINFSYENDLLVLTDFGMHNDTAIDYKFTKQKFKSRVNMIQTNIVMG